jgi:Serine dehydrogenase proteinase
MSTDETPSADPVGKLATSVAKALDADVLFYNGPIGDGLDHHVKTVCRNRRRRKNVLLILVTWGGDGDAAYRISKCLQSKYERVILYVTGRCKSAGTLIALGAHELVFGEHGELGPLDVQMSKEDSLWEAQSGLTVTASLTALQARANLAFQDFFLEIEEEMPSITVKTAAEIATNLTVGLFAPLYSQIDPLHVGEAARALQVADHYGRLLIRIGGNVRPDLLEHLIGHYPSHTFVIDMEEAASVFHRVRHPTEEEAALAEELGRVAIIPLPHERLKIEFLSEEVAAAPMAEQAVQIDATHETRIEGKNDRHKPRPRPVGDRPPQEPRAEPPESPTS